MVDVCDFCHQTRRVIDVAEWTPRGKLLRDGMLACRECAPQAWDDPLRMDDEPNLGVVNGGKRAFHKA